MKKLQRDLRTDEQQDNAAKYIANMERPEDGIRLTLQTIESIRTLEQNAFMWVALYKPIAEQISEATGAMVVQADIHKFLKERHGPRIMRTHPITLEQTSVPKSTTKYTKQEMVDYLDQGFAWGAQNGVWFPS